MKNIKLNKNILLLFTKNPRVGYVKTRLAATVGNEEALRIYRFLLGKTRAAAVDCAATRWLCYSETITANDEWDTAFFDKKVQPDGDLGERMSGMFRQAFEAGAEKVVIVGSDCPEVDGALLNDAFDQLDQTQVVIGPTPDGGYYLLGMCGFEPSLFEGVEWSSEVVFEQTMERAAAANLKVHTTPVLSDIDHEADWQAYLERQKLV